MNPNRPAGLRCALSLLTALLFASLTGCNVMPTSSAAPAKPLPIIFVHGNGDTAALWHTTLWRFESNGWPRDRLFALEFAVPSARSDDSVAQPGRSGTQDQLAELAAEIARVRALTGAPKVILVGNSRGGYAIRNFVRNRQGQEHVDAVVLGGVPNHGVWSGSFFAPKSEFNGSGEFLTALNAPQGPQGLEVTPGVRFLTLRSDNNDKFAQPDGRWIGQAGKPTGVSFDGPALKGAQNVVLPGKDHREVSFHADAFAATYQFITGRAPATTNIIAQSQVTLNGRIGGAPQGNALADATNLPLVGAKLSVFEVKPSTGERIGSAVHQKTIGSDGQWGPFMASPQAFYEFVIEAPGFASTHIYRSAFARSSDIINMRPLRADAADKASYAALVMSRPRGYFGVGRDRMSLDGATPPPGVGPGVAGISTSKIRLAGPVDRAVIAQFGDERIAMRAWPASENHISIAEFHY